ncbi:hypothetical protein V2I01_27160 [Micromonospora sp. BRA006-A]|nr:hypothetical protein [Micromonospora sp. BRA006-A]
MTANIAVQANPEACTTAPGYTVSSDGEYETFDGTGVPDGWSVVDNAGTGQVWEFTDAGERGNPTGGSGNRRDHAGDPVQPGLQLAQQRPRGRRPEPDGGTTWSNVLRQAADVRGPRVTEVPIPQAAGQSQVRVRFHYYEASWEWWWQVDNVLIGSKLVCKPVTGGLVLGHVRDKNDNSYVNGATVTSKDRPAEKATTVATPDDTELPDGFYWMFSSLTGKHPFTADAGNYVSQTKQVTVEEDWATAPNFQLAAGRLSVKPTSITGTVRMPSGKVSRTFTVTNTGGAPVTAEFSERDGGFVLQRADGSRLSEQALLGSTGAPAQRLTAATSFAARSSGKSSNAIAAAAPQADPWTTIPGYPANVMDNRVVTVDGTVYSIAGGDGTASSAKNYRYDPITQAWTGIADLPGARNAMTVGVLDGKIIATGGWGAAGPDAATFSYDPAANTWTRKADNPAPRAAAGQAVAGGKLYAIGGCTTASCTPMANSVVRYDPGADAWETLPAYPKSVAFLSCGGIDGTVYCTGGNDGTTSQKVGYAFDPSANAWTAIPDAPADSWASSYAVANGKVVVVGGSQGGAITNAGFAFDPATNSWANLPNANAPATGWRGLRVLQDRWFVGRLHGHQGQRGPARLRRVLGGRGRRELADRRQVEGHAGTG